MKDKGTDLLIGVSEVDVTVLGCLNTVDGYYKVKNTESEEEQGVLKLKIVPAIDFKQTISERMRLRLEDSPKFLEEDQIKTLKDVYETLKQIRGEDEFIEEVKGEFSLRKDEEVNLEDMKMGDKKLEGSIYDKHIERLSQELNMEESETLMKRHLQNLEELDLISKKLRGEVHEDFIPYITKKEISESEVRSDPNPNSMAETLKVSNVFERNLLNEEEQSESKI